MVLLREPFAFFRDELWFEGWDDNFSRASKFVALGTAEDPARDLNIQILPVSPIEFAMDFQISPKKLSLFLFPELIRREFSVRDC